jgi:hypothetical protein
MFLVQEGCKSRGINYRIYEVETKRLIRLGDRILSQYTKDLPEGILVDGSLEEATETASSLPGSNRSLEWFDSQELQEYVVLQLGCKTDLELIKLLFAKRADPDRRGNRVVLGYYFPWSKKLLFVPGPNDVVVYRAGQDLLPIYDKIPYTFMWNRYGIKCR